MSILSAQQIEEANERVRQAEQAHWDAIMNTEIPTKIPESEIIDHGFDYEGDEFDGSPIQREYVITKDGEIHYV